MIWNEILQWAVLIWLVFRVRTVWKCARGNQSLVLKIAAVLCKILGGDDDGEQN